MNDVKLNKGDLLICDPCYIREVKFAGENRFDILKLVKVLYEGDDGRFEIYRGKTSCAKIGVDSGRLWIFQVEYGKDVEIKVESGLSGLLVVRKELKSNIDEYSVSRL